MITLYSAKQKQLSKDEFLQLYEIIIHAYAETESEMWGKNYKRVSEEDFQKFIDADEVLIAYFNQTVAGGLRYYKIADDVFSFGLFGVDFSLSRKGIGRELISRVEEMVKKRGASSIRIEILRPENFDLPIKKILHQWYQQLGYRFIGSTDFAEKFPERAVGILVPCVFDFYEKKLG